MQLVAVGVVTHGFEHLMFTALSSVQCRRKVFAAEANTVVQSPTKVELTALP